MYVGDEGRPVFPLIGKKPAIEEGNGFHDATVNIDQVVAWRAQYPNANIGHSPGSMDQIVIDTDSPEAEATIESLGLNIPTLTVITARGRHRYYSLPKGIIVANGSPWKKQGVDVRAHGGYVLLPPSVHESGHVYRWENPDIPIAPLPGSVLEAILKHQREPGRGAVVLPMGNSRTASTLREIVKASKAQGIPAATIADALDRRVRKYIERVGNVGEGQRNSAAFQVAAWLLRDFGATTETTWAYLAEWNRANTPPLSERELRQTMRSASRSARRPLGCAHSGSAA